MTTPPIPKHEPPRRRFSYFTLSTVVAITAVVTIGVALLLTNIIQRKQEARNPFYRVVELTDTTTDPAIWGKNFPLQYDSYRRTVDQVRTRYGGSEALPHTPTQADPRSVLAQSRLTEDPRLRQLWAGYAFATDFREERGHAYMLDDQEFTRRQIVTKQPGTCLNCHASMYAAYRRVGEGDPVRGFERINALSYDEARKNVTHPVSCVDCHDPNTMQLRVTRIAFMEGMRMLKASQGVRDYDVNKQATRQEMRAYVCGQCHVEYYFKGKEKRLEYPWGKGLSVDSILAYHDSTGHADFTHAISGARVLKAQHPEFEMYNQGIHARSGVACADCHMPYERVGAMKISDHWVRSPMLNVNRACQTCHKSPEEELRARVETIQGRTYELRNIALDAVLKLATDIAATVRADSVANAARIRQARDYQRKAQFLADFIEAENSMGFHADQESARVLARAIDYARRGHLALVAR
ncbi:MAG: ammonia-forming cytochrome c nitrite reductase subunit c552 [Gemmatimonadaceae bacterium]